MSLFTTRTVSDRCPGCGAEHAACGPPSDTVPVDAKMMEVATMGGPLRKYRYRGTVLKLNDQDAARLALGEGDLAEGEPRGDDDPETVELPDDASAKAVASAPNKARTAAGSKSGRVRRKPPASTEGEPAAEIVPGAPEAEAEADDAGDGTMPSGSEPDGGGASGGGGGD